MHVCIYICVCNQYIVSGYTVLTMAHRGSRCFVPGVSWFSVVRLSFKFAMKCTVTVFVITQEMKTSRLALDVVSAALEGEHT